jgi:hypothetical protein
VGSLISPANHNHAGKSGGGGHSHGLFGFGRDVSQFHFGVERGRTGVDLTQLIAFSETADKDTP